MNNLFLFIFLISPILFIIGLIKPQIFYKIKITNRKTTSLVFVGLFLISFILFGITSDSNKNKEVKNNSASSSAIEISTSTKSINTLEEKVENLASNLITPITSLTQKEANTQTPTQNTEKTQNLANNNENTSDLYKVIEVVDGDTIKVLKDNQEYTLRLIGMDTPETKDPRKTVQCFGKEASDKAKSLLSNQYVKLEADIKSGELDKYQRLLRYVFLIDGTNYNEYMIKNGYAHEYTYNNVSYKYQKDFKEAELYAKTNLLGFWATNTCNGNTTQSADGSDPVAVSTDNPPIKKSTSGICHQINISKSYLQTTHFTSYNTLQECLDSGGRLPKN